MRLQNALIAASVPGLRRNLLANRAVGLETLLDYQRLSMLSAAVEVTQNVDGDIIEFGSFKGGSAGFFLRKMDISKTLHVFDSFAGMPEVSRDDNFHKAGDFSDTMEERVRKGLSSIAPNFEMHVGFFSQTLNELQSSDLNFCLAHIDADLYESILDSLAFTYPRMVRGGIMIFDDYGAPSCEGAKKAIDEFFSDKPETVVSLSQPAYGCVIGGGDAYNVLSDQFGFPLNLTFVQSKVFDRQ